MFCLSLPLSPLSLSLSLSFFLSLSLPLLIFFDSSPFILIRPRRSTTSKSLVNECSPLKVFAGSRGFGVDRGPETAEGSFVHDTSSCTLQVVSTLSPYPVLCPTPTPTQTSSNQSVKSASAATFSQHYPPRYHIITWGVS